MTDEQSEQKCWKGSGLHPFYVVSRSQTLYLTANTENEGLVTYNTSTCRLGI